VIGLRRYSEPELARDIATRWIRTDVAYYQRTGKLVGPQSIMDECSPGSVQQELQPIGSAGPTAGVLRVLMELYPDAVRSAKFDCRE
jgi:alpha,alpha-trehalase